MSTRRGEGALRVGRAARTSVFVGVLLATAALAMAAAGLLACGETRGLVLGERASLDGEAQDAGSLAETACTSCSVPVALAGQTATAQQGGTTGTPSVDTCPGEQVVVGYRGFLTYPEAGIVLIGGIQTVCGEMTVDEPSGQAVVAPGATLPVRGASQDDPWTQLCPPDEVVVGFAGRSGADLDEVAFSCAAWRATGDAAGAALASGTPDSLPAAGGDGGEPYEDTCPAGQLARGTSSRSGDWVDAFGLVCATPTLGGLDGGP